MLPKMLMSIQTFSIIYSLSFFLGEANPLQTGQNRKNAQILGEIVHLAEETKRDIFHQYFPRDPEQ